MITGCIVYSCKFNDCNKKKKNVKEGSGCIDEQHSFFKEIFFAQVKCFQL